MWGPSIVGLRRPSLRYESGREGDWFLAGFSPRKEDSSIYLMGGEPPRAGAPGEAREAQGSGGCLYIKRLADVDVAVLEKIVGRGAQPEGREAK